MTILDKILEMFPDEHFIKADGFDDAVIGVETSSGRLVYSIKKSIEILVQNDGMSYDDAADFFYYNVEGSYVGEKTPIWVNDTF
jgi:hypothetical protein